MKLEEKLMTIYRRLKPKKYGWFGDFSDWNAALKKSSGYDSDKILEKVKAAIVKVKNGEAVYERDSVLFDTIEYSWPLVSALLLIAQKNQNKLHLIDFGGSLGSSYFQNRQVLKGLDQLRWNVVEQEKFVEAGRKYIQDNHLEFFKNVDESILANGLPHLILLSCSLPYIEEPYSLLEYLVNKEAPYFMIDNTFFNWINKDRVTLQKVPPAIYEASYPCWLLDYEKVKHTVEKKYDILFEHTNDNIIEVDGRLIRYKGFLASLKKN